MARKPRLHVDGGLYHVMLRGNGGQVIFIDTTDRSRFYYLIQEGVERYGHRIHAYCLMSNHVHLLLQVGAVPLAKIMQNLSFRYTRWFNQRQGQSGHLFQGRYKALLVDADSYFLELVRYIHLNPVRSGMVASPEDYEWSGHRAYIGNEKIPWLTTKAVLSQFAPESDRARVMYARFVDAALDGEHKGEFHHGDDDCRVIGDDKFVVRVMDQCGERVRDTLSVDAVIASVCREFGIESGELCGPGRKRLLAQARGVAGWLLLECGQSPLAELARRMKRDPSSLSLMVSKVVERARSDDEFSGKLKFLRNNSITQ
ncbi:transposase [Mariprofundus erugo]|uniref:Transposase n=1 Tax=Mariprofundus erugo TaxID=2528639 RepID=A0A5R9GUU3_9PROT|nr:transposase [Mariprofundus erugo]TLS67967.1 transposase [Mariprofundus erugo]